MKKKNVLSQEDIAACEVSLRPIASVSPRIYVPIIWLILLTAVLFFLFVFPGLRNYGSKLDLSSEPAGSAIYVRDRYVGTTPWKDFVPAGDAVIRIEKPGFLPDIRELEIPGQLFFTLLYRKTISLSAELALEDSSIMLEGAVVRFAQSSGIMENTIFRYEPILRETARDLAIAGEGDAITMLLRQSLPHLRSSSQWYDFLAAMHVAAIVAGDIPSNFIASTLLEWQRHYPALISFATSQIPSISLYSPALANQLVEEENYYRNSIQERASQILQRNMRTNDVQRIEGMAFRRLRGGEFPMGYPFSNQTNLPYLVELSDYYIMEYELRKGDYLRFLNDTPVDTGILSERYLENFDALDDDDALSFVSWHHARAFAEWLDARLPAALAADYQASLPTEAEWEYAAYQYREHEDSGFVGGLWEWNSNWYTANPALADPWGEEYGYEKVVRGGSDFTPSAEYTTRGSQPANWSTPYLGFRLVLRRVSDE